MEKGLGDTIEKVIKVTRVDKVVSKISKSTEEECSPCKKRRDALNKMFPYKK